MKRSFRRLAIVVVLSMISFMTGQMPAFAQASRTWVSGVGDDANPCSRTAPCKTFAGAISKTAAKGEINVLDPGGFGAVTITKSITIDGGGSIAGVLTNAANAINVNVGASDRVILRHLDITGLGSATNGINFIGGGALAVSNVVIQGFANFGINITPNAAANAQISDVEIFDTNGAISVGAGAGNANVAVSNATMGRNGFGLRVVSNAQASVVNSRAFANSGAGFSAVGGPSSAVLNLEGSMSAQNAAGVSSSGPGAMVRIGHVQVYNNGAGLSGSPIVSFGTNTVAGNAPDGAPSQTLPQV